MANAVKRAHGASCSRASRRAWSWFSPYDSSDLRRISIEEVVKTLLEAIVLVFLVMLIFLQNFRATLIPTLVIPVALLGTFLGMYVLGFTINQLSLFGMVLAIGIVVDDAIVVIENVERIMTEEGLSPKEATRKAMHQITGAVIAITIVLAAVFIPSALQAGSAGAMYKQFALTIAMAMVFSAFLALGFTPALCASLLKPSAEHEARNFDLPHLQQVLREDGEHLRRPHRQRGAPCAALDGGVRASLRPRAASCSGGCRAASCRKKTRATRSRSCSCRRVRRCAARTKCSTRCGRRSRSWKASTA